MDQIIAMVQSFKERNQSGSFEQKQYQEYLEGILENATQIVKTSKSKEKLFQHISIFYKLSTLFYMDHQESPYFQNLIHFADQIYQFVLNIVQSEININNFTNLINNQVKDCYQQFQDQTLNDTQNSTQEQEVLQSNATNQDPLQQFIKQQQQQMININRLSNFDMSKQHLNTVVNQLAYKTQNSIDLILNENENNQIQSIVAQDKINQSVIQDKLVKIALKNKIQQQFSQKQISEEDKVLDDIITEDITIIHAYDSPQINFQQKINNQNQQIAFDQLQENIKQNQVTQDQITLQQVKKENQQHKNTVYSEGDQMQQQFQQNKDKIKLLYSKLNYNQNTNQHTNNISQLNYSDIVDDQLQKKINNLKKSRDLQNNSSSDDITQFIDKKKNNIPDVHVAEQVQTQIQQKPQADYKQQYNLRLFDKYDQKYNKHDNKANFSNIMNEKIKEVNKQFQDNKIQFDLNEIQEKPVKQQQPINEIKNQPQSYKPDNKTTKQLPIGDGDLRQQQIFSNFVDSTTQQLERFKHNMNFNHLCQKINKLQDKTNELTDNNQLTKYTQQLQIAQGQLLNQQQQLKQIVQTIIDAESSILIVEENSVFDEKLLQELQIDNQHLNNKIQLLQAFVYKLEQQLQH